MFPVILAKKDAKYPSNGVFYAIAANGPFVRKVLYDGYLEGLVRCDYDDVPGMSPVSYALQTEDGPVFFKKGESKNAEDRFAGQWWNSKIEKNESLDVVDPLGSKLDEGLVAIKPYIRITLPKLPAALLYKALLFFRAVYRKHRAEGLVIIAFNKTTNEYDFVCPTQQVSAASVDYSRDFNSYLPEGFKAVGTIHSHPNFNAYHSGVDTGDEQSFDGVHLTFGHVSDRSFSIASSLVMGASGKHDFREQVEPENVCVGLNRIGNPKASVSKWISSEQQNFFQIGITGDERKALKKEFEKIISEEWMPRVTQRSYAVNWSGNGGGWGIFGKSKTTSTDNLDEYVDEYEEELNFESPEGYVFEDSDDIHYSSENDEHWPDDEIID